MEDYTQTFISGILSLPTPIWGVLLGVSFTKLFTDKRQQKQDRIHLTLSLYQNFRVNQC